MNGRNKLPDYFHMMIGFRESLLPCLFNKLFPVFIKQGFQFFISNIVVSFFLIRNGLPEVFGKIGINR